jgi:hypothetical protein
MRTTSCDYDEGGGEMLDILVVMIRHAPDVGVADLVDAMDEEQTPLTR